MPTTLRYEIFTNPALTAPTIDFYTKVLGFQVVQEKTGYSYLQRDAVSFAIVERDEKLHTDKRAPPHGVELVFEVDDVEQEFDKVTEKLLAQGAQRQWDMVTGIERQEWGLRDFRVYDPAGYYLRISERNS